MDDRRYRRALRQQRRNIARGVRRFTKYRKSDWEKVSQKHMAKFGPA